VSILGGRRTLGPIITEMGGDPNPSSGGGGGSLTLENNISGYMFRSVGSSDKISGVEEFQFDGSKLKAQADLQISGSGHNLIIQGSDSDGNLNRMFKIEVSGGIFKAVPI